MFTGIIETLGKVVGIERQQGNMDICIECALAKELKIDQSVAHNGVCLTVVSKTDKQYTVTAIAETLEKTAIGSLQIGELVNLERAMIMGSRLDGHIVQGHVDQTG
jgi:riboflavin synthase